MFQGNDEMRVLLNVEDNHGGGSTNLAQQEFTIIITDVNDERPVFSNNGRYQAEIDEVP